MGRKAPARTNSTPQACATTPTPSAARHTSNASSRSVASVMDPSTTRSGLTSSRDVGRSHTVWPRYSWRIDRDAANISDELDSVRTWVACPGKYSPAPRKVSFSAAT